jgi:hypothetical protein
MPRAITDSQGRTVREGDADFDKVRIDNLEQQVREIQTAVIDLQNRVSRVDGEDLQWPADTYEPTYTKPFTGSG